MFGNFLGRLDDHRVLNDEGDEVSNRFHLREVEIDFRAAIDTFADGVLVTAFESEAPGEYEALIEEGYLQFKRFPFLDEAPGGLKLKAGRFRSGFGRANKLHTHDLPWVTRPPSLAQVLGEEGFAREGVAADFFLPSPGDSVLEATLEVLNGGGLPVGEDNEGEDLALVSRVHWFTDLDEENNVDLGVSHYRGAFDERGDRRAMITGADLTYQWKPLGEAAGRSILVGGELFYASVEGDVGERSATPLGWYAFLQAQLEKNLYLGTRFDRTQLLEDPSLTSGQLGTYLSYYTSEFLRVRLGWEHTFAERGAGADLDTVFLEFNFVFGSHPPHPYWANR